MKFSLSLLIGLFFSLPCFSQVMETESIISLGTQPGFMIDHPGADRKMVFKFLEDHYEEYGDVDRNRKAKEWYCESCEIPLLSARPMNVYFKVDEGKDQSTSYHFFDDGTRFISEKDDAIESFLLNIRNEVQKLAYRKEIEEQEEELEDLQDDLEDLKDDNKDLHEDIEEYREKIREAEKNIEKNLESQADKRMEIEKQKRVVEDLTRKLNNVGRG